MILPSDSRRSVNSSGQVWASPNTCTRPCSTFPTRKQTIHGIFYLFGIRCTAEALCQNPVFR